ncbi:DgaE family pyridoxal phosphate-dependent ammonia lyase [Lactiplantibacillus mudanjiangensis]|uniref:SelA-like pyridoxal phosphate-dependent enzyme [Lactobacillus pentosus] n=1 Tax=Lactiplantibacillus mudanjiangensis TaxID=1296538 RepID=A0A660DYA2_9LACO|nr:DgaE family pyridoxal phosphate-dependent ammonia lyase [Lactiplantibacillus mudanjiangensis]VDG22557.1 SelA-like pyridoxal phosphate-dependent enzyme [Lactobacillus pentosus] [Lactiplantibacillus mudanjiangensis]VDG26908.1 SelA-like pyridoxal phosphate-dependent enzyme [Lactobacillus pentosus] [Lactiplantibacillus mudanjiangensis]
MTGIYNKYHLKQVVNASGKMTILGVSQLAKPVIDAQKFGDEHFFEMADLVKKTGSHLAKLLGAEDAIIVNSASAGIAEAVAGLIGQGSQYHVYHPYDKRFTNREIIIPKGQNVDYGTPEEVMIEVGGGQVVEAGYANMCSADHIEMMITDQTVGILYVKSHHAVQKSMLSIEAALKVAHAHHLPLVLDAAAEEDMKKYIEMGVDIIIFSGAKALAGPASGLVFGRKQYIDWVRLQSAGLGRAMKIGKENIMGLTKAIEDYLQDGPEDGVKMKARLMPFVDDLNKVPYLKAEAVQDGAGRDIYRASVTVANDAPKNAAVVTAELKAGNPAIYTREYRANVGIIEFDIRAVNRDEMTMIVDRLQAILG